MRAAAIAKGLLTWVPGVYPGLVERLRGLHTGGSDRARYCYSVWLRHLSAAAASGLRTDPETVTELGPGDSIGIGLCALLTGARRYFALDVLRYARNEANERMLDELAELLRERRPIPDEAEFPGLLPRLPSYGFPATVLGEDRLARTLRPARIEAIRHAVRGEAPGPSPGPADEVEIRYVVPWHDPAVVVERSVDMAFSQAVLEHVVDLPSTYRALYRWLRPGGFMSHGIDFHAHGLTRDWNGHWAVSPAVWRIARGGRPYLLNRAPRSEHVRQARDAGFRIVADVGRRFEGGIPRSRLAREFRGMSDEDLATSGLFLQAVRD